MKKLLAIPAILLLTGCSLYKEVRVEPQIKNEKNIVTSEQALEIIKERYKQMEDSYTEIAGTMPTIYENEKRYYTLSNYQELTGIYTKKMLDKYNEDNNVLFKDDVYYSSSLPRTKADYDEINYTEISITEDKIKYNILLYKCIKMENEKCKNSSLTTNPFELERENDEWKISNYKVK